MTPRGSIFDFLRRFGRARRGAAAVEFALVALPFLTLVFAVLELGMIMLVNTTLNQALGATARMVRTGQVTNATASSAAGLKTVLCTQMSWLGASCSSKLNLDVRSFASFTGVTGPDSTNALNAAKMCWDTGGPGSVVLVTAYYPWTVFAPVLNSALLTSGNSTQRVIVATAAFKNEPYDDTVSSPKACP
ncbi:MAG: pilus assembly protein TadE [Caulobacteraceae bacterium]|nr:pilus assembly protein TadE [Caulobacteraceae bacterium]